VKSSLRTLGVGGMDLQAHLYRYLRSSVLSEAGLAGKLRTQQGAHLAGQVKTVIETIDHTQMSKTLNRGTHQSCARRLSSVPMGDWLPSSDRTTLGQAEKDGNFRYMYDVNRQLMEQFCFISNSYEETLATYQTLQAPVYGFGSIDYSTFKRTRSSLISNILYSFLVTFRERIVE